VDDVEWLDAEELTAWIRLMAMMELLPSAIDAQLKRDSGMNRFEYMVLAGLSDSPGHTMPMSDLALMASGSLSRLSHALGRLEAKGWVERRPVGVGRRVDVVLTVDGAAANAAAAAAHVREARRLVVDALTPGQLTRLGQYARAIVTAIDPDVAATIDDATRRATRD
jgi:DNA-binding MarR family transcriptional regulator